MRTQIGVEAAAGSVQRSGVLFNGIAQRANRVHFGSASRTPTIRPVWNGTQWAVQLGRFVTLHGATRAEVKALAASVLGHTRAVSRTAKVGR